MLTIKSSVYKLHLRHFMIDKKLQFPLHQFQIPKSETFINRRKAIAAGKWTAPAGFIINDLILKIFDVIIHKRYFAQVHHRTGFILNACSLFPVYNSPDYAQIVPFSQPVFHQFQKRLFPFSAHHTRHLWIPLHHRNRIVGNFRTAKPDLQIRQYFVDFGDQLLYI